MKLLVKFNLILAIVFAIGIAATAYASRELLQRNARGEIYENAKLLVDSALAVREYTSTNIAPLLETQIRYEFRPEMVSAFSAIEVLKKLRDANPEYKQFLYREAVLNPTNPANKAVDWENDVISAFRNGTVKPPLSGERDTPNGPMLFFAKPLKIGEACLRCHDTAEPYLAIIVGGGLRLEGGRDRRCADRAGAEGGGAGARGGHVPPLHAFDAGRAAAHRAGDEPALVVDVHPPGHQDLGAGRPDQPGGRGFGRLRRQEPR